MDELILQVGGKSQHAKDLFRCKSTTVSVGRGFDNDIVISDPHVGAHQILFEQDSDVWVMRILDTTNPVLLNKKAIKSESAVVKAGDHITIGRTQLHTYSPNFPVEETRKILFSEWLGNPLSLFWVPALLLTLVSLLTFLQDYLGTTTSFEWENQTKGVVFTVLFLLIWAGIWALAGRLLKHQANFSLHLLLVSIVVLAFMILIPITEYLEYYSSSLEFGSALRYALTLLGLTFLLAWDFTFATNVKRVKIVAFSIAFVVAFLNYILIDFQRGKFGPSVSLVLKPPHVDLAPSTSLDNFLLDLENEANEEFEKQMERDG